MIQRLQMAVITPHAQYNGAFWNSSYLYRMRFIVGSDSAEPFDIRTDTNDKFYYLWRKSLYLKVWNRQTERDTYGLIFH